MGDWENLLARLRWQDVLDVAILTFVAFRAYLWLRGTVALQVLLGMGALVVAAVAASVAGLVLTAYLLQAVGAVAALVAVVVFQGEIRRGLRRVDPIRWWRGRRSGADAPASARYRMLADALVGLADKRMGALVVLPRTDAIDEHVTGGTRLDALVSVELLESVFHVKAPIHDGAAVVKDGRVERAGGFLPLSTSAMVPESYGTRHRAALGLTEHCDAVVLVVSEERGSISLVVGGRLVPAPLTGEALASFIDRRMRAPEAEPLGRAATAAGEAPGGPARRRLRDAVALLAILLVVLGSWYALAGDRSTMISTQQSVELREAPAGYDVELVTPAIGEVQVTLQGPRRLLYSRARDEVMAWVNVKNAEPGRNRLEVRTSAPAGLEVVGTDPTHVVLRLKAAAKKQK